MSGGSRPWSVDETHEEMQAVAESLEDQHSAMLEAGRAAARAKWAAKRAKAKARAAGAAVGSNKEERDDAILLFKIPGRPGTPDRTVADLCEEADRTEYEFQARREALKATIEQGRLIQSLHVTGREASPR